MGFNHGTPYLRVFVRDPYLYNCDFGKHGFTSGVVIGVSSIRGRALGFHVLLDSGALIHRMPIHSLCTKPSVPIPLDHAEIWDCFSNNINVIRYPMLKELRCRVHLKDHTDQFGTYHFTIDWADGEELFSFAEIPDEHKCAHIIELDGGQLVAQPNNRILWIEQSRIGANPTRPDYKINTHKWVCEHSTKWACAETDQFMYTQDKGAKT